MYFILSGKDTYYMPDEFLRKKKKLEGSHSWWPYGRCMMGSEALQHSLLSGPTFLRGLCSSHLLHARVWYLQYLVKVPVFLRKHAYIHARTHDKPTNTNICSSSRRKSTFLFLPFVTCRQMPNHSGRVYSWDRQTSVLLSRLQREWWVLNHQKSSRNLARKNET